MNFQKPKEVKVDMVPLASEPIEITFSRDYMHDPFEFEENIKQDAELKHIDFNDINIIYKPHKVYNMAKFYTIYANNVQDSYLEELIKAIQYTEVPFDVIKYNMEPVEASRGVATNSVAVYCYFVPKEFIEKTLMATKIYDEGLGHGVCIANVNIKHIYEQFKSSFETEKEALDWVTLRIIDSIDWCENYLNVGLTI